MCANQCQSKIGLPEQYFQGPRSGVRIHRLGEYQEFHIDSDRGEMKEQEAGEMEEKEAGEMKEEEAGEMEEE